MSSVLIAGVDEVGRGPLAGPVVTAAVILGPDCNILGLTDSKKLSEKRREQLVPIIREQALAWNIGMASVEEIDELNILQATFLAMQRAVAGLSIQPQRILVDGHMAPEFGIATQTIIKGDLTEPAISAASILAKVSRDHMLNELDLEFPGYGLAKHKGYPTKQHLAALATLGITSIHRRSFKPVKQYINV